MVLDFDAFKEMPLTDKALKEYFSKFSYFPETIEWLNSPDESGTKLDRLIAKTAAVVQSRVMGWAKQLCRDDKADGVRPESRWERTIWRKFRPNLGFQPVSEFHPLAPRILSYAVPLYGQDESVGWGEIDLLGISRESLPVVIELKSENSQESPLSALMEAVRYSIALRASWKQGLRGEWIEELNQKGLSGTSDLPNDLAGCQIIIAAPLEYWTRRGAQTNTGERWKQAWAPFRGICDRLASDHGMPVEFVQLEFSARSLQFS